jgi:hypothetical protein
MVSTTPCHRHFRAVTRCLPYLTRPRASNAKVALNHGSQGEQQFSRGLPSSPDQMFRVVHLERMIKGCSR